jgi:hypothetical protein
MRLLIATLVLLLFCVSPLRAGVDVAKEAKSIQDTLNPINLALGPAIDRAISDGNDALAQRLEQLRSIIQEALFTVNKIITDATINVNSDAAGRLTQLNEYVQRNLANLNGMANGTIDILNKDSADRIDQLSNNAGNLIEAIPFLKAQPLPNVPKVGFSLVKAKTSGAPTPLFITGAGFLKDGVKPKAFVLTGNYWADFHTFSHNGTEVPISAASMGLIELQVPEALFPKDSQVERTLVLVLNSGGFLKSTVVEPSFPLLLCSTLPKYTVKWSVASDGQLWATRTQLHPKTEPNGHLYIDNGSDGGTAATRRLCPADLNEGAGGWNNDPNAGHNGMEYKPWYDKIGEEHIGHVTIDAQGCIELYAARDSSGGGHAQVWGVLVHQRKLTNGRCGANPASDSIPVDYGKELVIDTHQQDLANKCAQVSEGAAASPRMTVYVDVFDEKGNLAGHNELPLGSFKRPVGSSLVSADVTQAGTLTLTVASNCLRSQ